MAVIDQTASQLRLVFYEGEDLETGEPVYKAKTFNNVKTSATADQIYAVAKALETVQERLLSTIERKDTSEVRKA